MIQLSPVQVTPGIRSMFDLAMPTGIRALAVLAGGIVGKIFTDDLACPHWGLVWEADDGVLYRGGGYDRQILSTAVNLLRQEGLVAMGFCDGDASADLFPANPSAGAECLEFDRPIASTDLSPLLEMLPAGYSVHRMDQALLERSPRLGEKMNRYGSVENLLSSGLAVCVLHDGEIVCDAYADMEIMGRRELGVATQAAYRRQGLATVACAHLIRLCEESGSQTYWDCARFNRNSVALARKLGFQNERAYKLLAWFGPG